MLRCLALLLLLCAPAGAQDVALKVGKLLPGGGAAPLDGATVLVREGKVVALGHQVEVPDGLPVIERPRAWLVPGLVDPSTTLGARGDVDETARPLNPDAALTLDPGHRDLRAARAAGITTVALSPGDASLVGGAVRLVKTTGAPVAARPLLKLSLGPAALAPDRPPTSRAGAVALLRAALAKGHAEAPPADAGDALLVAFARGETAGLWSVGGPLDVSHVLDLAAPYGLRVALRLSPGFDVDDTARAFGGTTRQPAPAALPPTLSLLGVVVGPYELDGRPPALRAPAALHARGLRVLFTSTAPAAPPASLRLSAALAVRHGLPADAAFDALGRGAAEALGVADRVGTIEPGKDADLVLLDGPPLDPASRVLETWVDGVRVYSAAAERRAE